jgi:hypothetical protein
VCVFWNYMWIFIIAIKWMGIDWKWWKIVFQFYRYGKFYNGFENLLKNICQNRENHKKGLDILAHRSQLRMSIVFYKILLIARHCPFCQIYATWTGALFSSQEYLSDLLPVLFNLLQNGQFLLHHNKFLFTLINAQHYIN